MCVCDCACVSVSGMYVCVRGMGVCMYGCVCVYIRRSLAYNDIVTRCVTCLV